VTTGFTARHPRFVRALAGCLVALAALLAAVWLAPRASGSAAAWLRTPAVHLRTLRAPGDGRLGVGGGTGRAATAPLTLEAGVFSDRPAAGAVTVKLRTSLDGVSWSRWHSAPLETVDEDGHAQAFTDPVWTGAGRYVQVAATGSSHQAPSSLAGVRVVTIDPTEDSTVAARVEGAVRRVAVTVAALGAQEPAAAVSTQPVIVTRAEWGADESLRSGSPSYSPVKMAFVHHTASSNDYTQADAPALVRAIYAYHTQSLGWSDIGYNFLIDRFGTIYEGRYGGVGRGVVGAQVGGFNTGSTGIAMLGTFSTEAPPPEAITSLERLLAWKLGVAGLDPQGTATLTCGLTDKFTKGEAVTFPVIAGHRQANYTECPGDALYALLPAIRADVAQRMGGGGGDSGQATLTASTPVISPNGDGLLDGVDLSVAITPAADWNLSIEDGAGRTVASWNGSGQSSVVHWDGTSSGSAVPDGTYTAQLTAGADAPATTTLSVDTSAPRLTSSSAAPSTFSPNGDGQADTCVLTYAPAEACSVRIGVLDAEGTTVRWLQDWRAQQAQPYTVAWDGRVTSGSSLVPAPDGAYRFAVERRDAAGNVGRRGIPVTIDRTIGFPTARPATFSPNGDGVADTTRIAFNLTRTASVTLRVAVGDRTLRTLALGTLAAGTHAAMWDGAAGAGDPVASCRPAYTLTAVSSVGASSVTGKLVVDLYRPKVYAGGGKSATAGAATELSCKVVDPYSAQVDVRYTIADARGHTVTSGHAGRLATGKTLRVSWKPRRRGAYTVTWHATDLAGNREATAAATVVTVR